MNSEMREFSQKLAFLEAKIEQSQGEERFQLQTQCDELLVDWIYRNDPPLRERFKRFHIEERKKAVYGNLDITKYMKMSREEIRTELERLGMKEQGVHEQLCRDIAIIKNFIEWINRPLSEEEIPLRENWVNSYRSLRAHLHYSEEKRIRTEERKRKLPRELFMLFLVSLPGLVTFVAFRTWTENSFILATLGGVTFFLIMATCERLSEILFGRPEDD
jgi:hypothetical protein